MTRKYDSGGFLPGALSYGTQTNPLDSFSVEGRTGNKTTNKDLPDWLKAIGMKGDAYAGGMLKPELRYGFAYKKGKIHFADGTVYDATKNKDGTFSYKGTDGTTQSYDPTDEQDAYNQAYHKATSNQSVLDKATNAVKFELDHGLQVSKGILSHPQRILTGAIDPLSTKLTNAVTGSHYDPLVDQMGGALDSRYADYERRTGESSGYAKDAQGVAHVIASFYGGKGLGKLAGAGARSLAGTEMGSGALGKAATLGAKYVASNPKLLAGALRAGTSALSPAGDAVGVAPPTVVPGGSSSTLPADSFSRTQLHPEVGVRYGMGPEATFFTPGKADGGALKHYPLRPKGQPSQELRNFSTLPGMRSDPRVRVAVGDGPTQLVSRGTGAGGREDNIDAKLSENEYVIDAETVSLLGDGSPEAGAKKLDAMREGIRKHKGAALARGKISPNAKPGALHYLAEGGKVGVLSRLLKAKPDPNAGLKRIRKQLDDALAYKAPRLPAEGQSFEDFARDILHKKDSDILEGK